MEAANPQRAAIRLALALGGVALTVCLATATAALVWLRPAASTPTRQAGQPDRISERDFHQTGPAEPDELASYQLPPGALHPISAGPLLGSPREVTPLYVEPEPPLPESATAPEPIELADADPPHGPVTIHNPAALGPPDDDSLPPLPSETSDPASAVAESRPPADARRATSGKPPIDWEQPVTPITSPGVPLGDLVEVGQPEPIAAPVAPVSPPVDRETLLNYTTSTNDLSRRLKDEVQAGFRLGKSGAVYAARARFIAVLRRIALAKDAEEGSSRHTDALATGLRTLDDADDFVPRGDALEAELDVAAIAASHRLLLATGSTAPHEAIARYSQHAAQLLAVAAAGEPSGSMALYGLGKTYARLEAQSSDPCAGRKSLVMFRAAVDTHPENYLAANELGVRLARGGRYEQARSVLRKAAAQPTAIATVHANLAAIEARLGRAGAAVVAQQQSDLLAQQERAAGAVSQRHGVQWVTPDAFRRADPRLAAHPAPTPAATAPVAYEQPVTPAATPGGWTGFWQGAKRKLGWSSEPTATSGPYPAAIPVASQPQRVVR